MSEPANGALDYDTLGFDVVDVFTDRPFAGNPLAVVYGTQGLITKQLQAIAREFNHSETAFAEVVDGPTGGGADYLLRIFTPLTELPFAGHPSIGAAWALRRRGLVLGRRVRQECRAGVVRLEHGVEPGDLVWLTGMTPRTGAPVDPAGPLAAVGLAPSDLVGLATLVAGAGLDFCYLLVRPGAVARAMPDVQRLRGLRGHGGLAGLGPGSGPGLGAGLGGVAVVGWHDGGARVRVFTDDIGTAEDPATGSAALGLGAVLVSVGLLPPDGDASFAISQGVELGRPSTLNCRVQARQGVAVGCQVGGHVVAVASGTIRRPPAR